MQRVKPMLRRNALWSGSLLLVIIIATGLFALTQNADAQVGWQTFTDPRYDFTVQYPQEWTVIPRPRDDDPEVYGGVVKLVPPERLQGATPAKIQIGLRTIPLKPAESLTQWFDGFIAISEPFYPSDFNILSQQFIPFPTADGGQAFLVTGVTPLTEFMSVEIPRGEGIWYLWTNMDLTNQADFLAIANSFQFGEDTPFTLEDAFGPVYNPVPRGVDKSQTTTKFKLVRVGLRTASLPAYLPAYWYAPVPSGTTYNVQCGSGAHTGAEYYSADIQVGNGTAVYNTHQSWVDFAGDTMGGYGILVKTSTDFLYSDVYVVRYAHLESVLVSPGQDIGTLRHIAYSDNTGDSSGPHLHFSVQKNGNAENLTGLINFNSFGGWPETNDSSGYCAEMWR